MINVTKTYLPSFEKYTSILKRAWDKSWLTNNGELVQELEQRLKEMQESKYLFYCTNGTIVLQMALKALDITKEVITTPFSYVATVNAILWEGCKPVFVDIDPDNFCIDANKIEEAITPDTQAILATHVYGYPCNIEKIEELAKRYNLKVIYDGAHSFGCYYKGKPLLSYGDISTCSFHATKVFHSVEGGSISTQDDEIGRKLLLFRQFGHIYDDYFSVGINAKNSEFHAAMGICVLDDFNYIISCRKKVNAFYNDQLQKLPVYIPSSVTLNSFQYNYSYYPVIFPNEKLVIDIQQRLKEAGYGSRRYFYPSLNTLPFINGQNCPVSQDIASRVLCLPFYHDLSEEDQVKIATIVRESFK